MEIYIGVDWARHGAVAVLSWQGREVRHTFERTIAGVRSLVGAARKLSRAPETPMRAAIEDGDRSLAALLVAHGMTVHVAEPTKAKNFAASLSSSRAKDDRRDARNLAKFAMSPLHRNEPYQVPSDQSEALGCLVAAHESAVNKSQRLVNQLRAKLVEVFPAIEVALGDLTTRTSLDLLMLAPTWAHGAAVSDREWETFARQHRIHEVRRAALRTALQEPWRTFGPTLASAHAIVVRALVGELRASVESIASIDRELEAVSARDPNAMRLRTVSGVGLIIASGLIDLGLGQSRPHSEPDARGREAAAPRPVRTIRPAPCASRCSPGEAR